MAAEVVAHGVQVRRAIRSGPLGMVERLRVTHSRRLVRFCLVGGCGVLINMGALAMLVSVAGWKPVFAAPLATELAVLNNFILNDRWTFHDRHAGTRLLQRAARYNAITFGGLVLSVAILTALVHYPGLHYLVANLVAIGAGVLWNYAVNSRLTWTAQRTTTVAEHPGPARHDRQMR